VQKRYVRVEAGWTSGCGGGIKMRTDRAGASGRVEVTTV
jgi:hypothetical protein